MSGKVRAGILSNSGLQADILRPDIDTLRSVIYFYISDSPTETFPLLWEGVCLHPKVEAAHYMRFDEIDPELIHSEQQLSLNWTYNQPPTEYICQQKITPAPVPVEFEYVESVSSNAAETSSEETSDEDLAELSRDLGLAGIAPAHSQEEFSSFLKRALDIYDKDEQPFHLFLKRAIAVYEDKDTLASDTTFLPSASALPAECHCIASTEQ